MRTFQPSVAFSTFFNQVIASAEAPVVAGGFSLAIPVFPDPEEQAFADTVLAALITQIDVMRKSVSPPPAPNPYALDANGQPLYPESWGTTAGAP
jgi:hypothetical protein